MADSNVVFRVTIKSIEEDIAKHKQLLGNAEFRTKAPKDKVDNMLAALAAVENQRDAILEQLKMLA